LFRPFYRGSNAARAEGHGLGLAIVQRVARVHGGTVDATNAEGGGLRVCLRLPLAADIAAD
jgi:two-component system OmpR family sensor kinase